MVKAGRDIQIFIGTPEKEEFVLFLGADDLIAVSAFETGEKAEKGIKSMVYLLKEFGSPIVVLPKDHPTSKDCHWLFPVENACVLTVEYRQAPIQSRTSSVPVKIFQELNYMV